MREAHALEGPVLTTQPHTGRARESLGVLRGRGQTGMSPGALQSPESRGPPPQPCVAAGMFAGGRGLTPHRVDGPGHPLIETLAQTRLFGQRTRCCPTEPRQLSQLPWGDFEHWAIFILLYKCQ